MAKYRITLEDKRQDLTEVEVTASGSSIGVITGVSASCSPTMKKAYLGKACDVSDNSPGEFFNYADASDGFRSIVSNFRVEKVEEI